MKNVNKIGPTLHEDIGILGQVQSGPTITGATITSDTSTITSHKNHCDKEYLKTRIKYMIDTVAERVSKILEDDNKVIDKEGINTWMDKLSSGVCSIIDEECGK